MINQLRKRNETLTNKQEQYKGALCTLNMEVTEKLKEEAVSEKRHKRPR